MNPPAARYPASPPPRPTYHHASSSSSTSRSPPAPLLPHHPPSFTAVPASASATNAATTAYPQSHAPPAPTPPTWASYQPMPNGHTGPEPNATTPAPTTSVEPPKVKKKPAGSACNSCHRLKTRCSGGKPCDRCASHNIACEFDRSLVVHPPPRSSTAGVAPGSSPKPVGGGGGLKSDSVGPDGATGAGPQKKKRKSRASLSSVAAPQQSYHPGNPYLPTSPSTHPAPETHYAPPHAPPTLPPLASSVTGSGSAPSSSAAFHASHANLALGGFSALHHFPSPHHRQPEPPPAATTGEDRERGMAGVGRDEHMALRKRVEELEARLTKLSEDVGKDGHLIAKARKRPREEDELDPAGKEKEKDDRTGKRAGDVEMAEVEAADSLALLAGGRPVAAPAGPAPPAGGDDRTPKDRTVELYELFFSQCAPFVPLAEYVRASNTRDRDGYVALASEKKAHSRLLDAAIRHIASRFAPSPVHPDAAEGDLVVEMGRLCLGKVPVGAGELEALVILGMWADERALNFLRHSWTGVLEILPVEGASIILTNTWIDLEQLHGGDVVMRSYPSVAMYTHLGALHGHSGASVSERLRAVRDLFMDDGTGSFAQGTVHAPPLVVQGAVAGLAVGAMAAAKASPSTSTAAQRGEGRTECAEVGKAIDRLVVGLERRRRVDREAEEGQVDRWIRTLEEAKNALPSDH